MERSEFEKLSKKLSDSERQDLLSKLKSEDKKDSENGEYTQNIIKDNKNTDLDEQLKIALENYKKSGFLNRIIILITSFFSGKNKEELLIEKEFTKLKKEIQSGYANIIDFNSNQLTHNLANEIILLNESVLKVRDLIENFFSDDKFYREFLFTYFEKQFGESLNKSMQSLNPENVKLNEVIDKAGITREKDRRIKDFFDFIDKTKFDFVFNQIGKLEIALKIIKFDYSKILQPFGITNFKNLAEKKNSASFISIEKNLERLYSLLLDFNFSGLTIPILLDFADFTKSNYISESQEIFNKSFTEQDIKKITDVFKSFKVFFEKVPLDKIFKYFKKDILYKPSINNYTLDLVSVYKDLKRKKIDDMWGNYYLNLKRNELNKLIHELFGDTDFFSLHYFNNKLYDDIFKYTSVKLTSIYFINILLFFIRKFYRNNIEAFVGKILIDGSFIDEMAKFHLSGAYHTINNSFEKVNLFDVRFNSDNDYGKKIKLYIERTAGINDPDLKKSFQSYVADINTNGLSLSNEIYNGLNTIKTFFNNLSPATPKSERPISNIDSIRVAGNSNILILIDKHLEVISKFFKIYKQIELIY